MASQIDRVGAFRGRIIESGVGTTKNGYPQFTGRFFADQMWIEDKDQFANFGITEPSWVDWSGYEQDLTGFLVLMTEDKETRQFKEIFHMEALKKALGWDGASFGTLGTTDWSKTTITFWVEENEYQGNVSLRIAAIDAADASPNRTLRTLDANALKDLDSKFAGMLAKKTVVATAAPAKAAPAKAPGKPASPPAGAPKPGATTAPAAVIPSTAAPSSAKSAAPSKTPPKGPPKTPPKPDQSNAEALGGAEMTYSGAWDHVCANRGSATDDQMAEKWIDAQAAVAPGKDESTMTGAEFAALAAKTLELLKG